MVRPEEIRVSQIDAVVSDENEFTAILKTITLLGPVTRLTLDFHGQPIIADIKTVDRDRFVLEKPVKFSFNRAACRVMSGIDLINETI